MKKFISFLMCAFLCVGACSSLIACGGETMDYGNKVVIQYAIGDGGFGRAHADDLAARFMEKYGDKKYGDKEGVVVEVVVQGTTSIASAETNGIHVTNVSTEGVQLASSVREGHLANVNDVVTGDLEQIDGQMVSIEDKIPEYARGMYQGDPVNGVRNYYAVPGYSYSPGLTLDHNSFDKYGYFLANEDGDNVEFTSPLTKKTYYFTVPTDSGNDEATNKTPGPDMVSGTQDDGMPANMLEFVALCEKIKSDDRSPFIAAGKFPSYQKMFAQAFFINLLGKQQLETWLNFDGGDFEIVTGYTNEPLFPGLDPKVAKIYKPITKKVKLTEENGFYSTWSAAEYYTVAFTQLACLQQWFHDGTTTDTYTQNDAILDFLVNAYDTQLPSAKQPLMLVEMNFWQAEAKKAEIYNLYDDLYNQDGHEPRRLTWMSLPRSFDGYFTEDEVEEGLARQVLYTTNANGLGIAKYVEEDPALFEACKDLLRFYCTDNQMNRWTKQIGITKTLDYKISDETLLELKEESWYAWKLSELGNTNMDNVYQYAENDTFKNNYLDYRCGYHGCPLSVTLDGSERGSITAYFLNLKNSPENNTTAKRWFEAGMIYPEQWVGKYYGKFSKEEGWKDLTDAQKAAKFPYSLDENEQPIVFNKDIPA